MSSERSAHPMANGDVGSWPKREVPDGSRNVCCWGQTGRKADITKPTLLTRSGTRETQPLPWRAVLAAGFISSAEALLEDVKKSTNEQAEFFAGLISRYSTIFAVVSAL